jgi:hypothetical protein
MEATQQPTTARKGGNKGVLIILIIMIVLLSAASGYLVWNYLQSKKAFDGLKVENTTLKQTNDAQKLQLDSLSKQVEMMKGYIPQEEADALKARIAELEEQVKNTPTRVVYSGGGGNKKEIEDLKAEIADWKSKYDALLKERDDLKLKNTQLEQEKTTLSQEKDKLNNTNKTLQDKVDVAAQLKFYDTMLSGYKLDKKGNKKFEEKAKKVMGLEVSFKIQENSVADEGEKICYIVIMGPNKKVLSESTANVFQVNGVDKVYTLQKSFYFNNKQALISADYKTGEQLKDGEYTAEIYVDGKLSGTAANYLKK